MEIPIPQSKDTTNALRQEEKYIHIGHEHVSCPKKRYDAYNRKFFREFNIIQRLHYVRADAASRAAKVLPPLMEVVD
jgi:hypothetical protein